MQAQFNDTNDIHQEAYTHLQSLKKNLFEEVWSTNYAWKYLQIDGLEYTVKFNNSNSRIRFLLEKKISRSIAS